MGKVKKGKEEIQVFDLKVPKKIKYLLIAVVILTSTLNLIYILFESYNRNGYFSFPLDDPWIHLQFAKNLNQYGSFSYYKDEMVTSGSTSPLYTFLLFIGFYFTDYEFILSYFFGIVSFICSIIFFYKILNIDFGNSNLISISGTTLFSFMWFLQWSALSGMETTTMIFFLLAAIYFYKKNSFKLFGICSGMLVWLRPEALIFYGIIIIDLLYKKFVFKKIKNEVDTSQFKAAVIINFVFLITYFAFNYFISGTIFPNTFAAKTKYYSGNAVSFFNQVFTFFTQPELILLCIFNLVALIVILKNFFLKKHDRMFIYMGWLSGMILAFSIFLPFLYQRGRYLFPVLPAFIILGIYGLINTWKFLGKFIRAFSFERSYIFSLSIVLLIITVQSITYLVKLSDVYVEDVRYIHDRQIITAKWIKENLPENIIVATHDVGAIGFYSGRKIVDMVGLISPDMIPNIGSFDKLKIFLDKNQTTHLAVLRNWFHVVNQNPIFSTDKNNPEVMEVFEYYPNSEFAPQNVVRWNEQAEHFLKIGNIQNAAMLLDQSMKFFPNMDWTYYLFARLFMMVKDYHKAELALRNALRLNPDYVEAKNLLKILEQENK